MLGYMCVLKGFQVKADCELNISFISGKLLYYVMCKNNKAIIKKDRHSSACLQSQNLGGWHRKIMISKPS